MSGNIRALIRNLRKRELEQAVIKAAKKLDTFAWSAVTADCKESHKYLQRLIADLHGAFRALEGRKDP